jgi:PEP-CTERM/exosortase A-associated glycosyltransferase
MRILHILDHSIPLQSGYTFRTLSILAAQRERGWETVHLTSPKHTRPFVPEETEEGWLFYRTPPVGRFVASLPIYQYVALMQATARRLDEVVEKTKPDILHAHSPVLNAIPALRVGRARGIPVVYEVRGFWEDAAASHGSGKEMGLRYRLSRRLESYALRRANAIAVICEGLRQDLLERGIPDQKVTVIPNAVNPAEFSLPPRDQALADKLGLRGAVVIGFLGSFYSYEGLHLLIEALPAMLREMPELRLLLVGGGPADADLRARAQALGVGAQTIFTGRVPHSDVNRYYALIDVLAYPRVRMRLTDLVTPLKPLEAMALGKIVVASDVGGHRELIRDGETGNLFRADDKDELARTMLRVLRHRDVWPAQLAAGRRYVEAERTWTSSVANYEPVYTRLLSHRALS